MDLMDPRMIAELLDGLDELLTELNQWQGKVTEDSPVEERRKALAAGFAHTSISLEMKNMIETWGDPRGNVRR